MALHFDITGDNKNLLRSIEGSKQGIRSLTREAEKESMNLDDIMKRIGQSAAAIGLGFSATQLIRDVARVRGEFQQLEVALNTMLGSEEKANALFEQLVNTAAKTPFDLKGVAGGAKQLLAYGVAAEEVNDTIIRLGDIAAGLSIPLGDLVYLYGTTMTQGRLFTQDLRQFMGRGIPLAEELAKQFGVTKDEVGGLVTAGKVGFSEVQKAIMAMTSEGGKFAGLMEKQSKTITGQISNLQDAVDSMLNEIGKSTQGAISGVLNVTTELVENYEKVGEAIGVIATAYGSYKAAQAISIAYKKVEIAVLRQAVLEKTLAAGATTALSNADLIAAARAKLLTNAYKTLISTLKAKTAAILTNPYVLAAAAITAVTYGIYKYTTATSAADEAQQRLDDSTKSIDKSIATEILKLDSLQRKLKEAKEGTDEYNGIKADIVSEYGQYYEGLDGEISRVGDLSTAYTQLVANMRKTIGERQFQSFFNKEQEHVDKVVQEKIDKAYDVLIEKYGQSEGLALYQQFYNSIMNGVSLTSDAMKKLKDASFWETTWGEDAQDGIVDFRNNVFNLRKEINATKKASESAIKAYQQKYNITDDMAGSLLAGKGNEPQEEGVSDGGNLGKAYREAEAKWKEARAALDEATREKNKYSVAQYKEFVRKEKEAADAFKELGGDTSKKVGDERAKNEERAGEMFLEIVRRNNRDRIELEHEGNELLLQQIEQDYQDRIAEIEKQEQELMELQGGTLNPEQQAEFNRSRSIALEQRNKSTKEVEENIAKEQKSELEELLADYLTYEQKREQIQKEYAEKRKKMQEAGVGQGNIDILNQEEADALSATDEAFAQKSSTYRTWLNEITTLTLTELEAALIEAQEMLATLDQEGASEEQKMEARAKISKLGSKIQQMKEDNTMSPEKRSIEDWKELADVLKDCGDEFGALGDEVGGTAGEILKSVGSITSTALGMVNNIVQIVDMSTNGMKATAEGAATAISTVEKASVILAIISVALQLIQKIVNFANKMHDGKYDEVIDRNQKKIDNLEKSYEDLAEAIDEAFGSTAVQGLRDMNANLEQQNRLIQEQKQAEEEKKKTDEETVKGYDDAMEENRKQIEANKKAMEEAIFGEDIKSAIENFSEAYADAVSDNMSMNQSAAEQAKQAMKKMVMESIKEYVAGSNKIQAIRDKMQALYADGVFSTEDQKIITDLYKNLNKEIDQKFEWAEEILSDSESSSSEESSNRGIATASQESVDENNGRLMSIQLSMGEITAHMAGIVASLSSITSVSAENNIVLSDIRTLQVQSNGWLEDIAKYTKPLNESITSIVEQLKKMQ